MRSLAPIGAGDRVVRGCVGGEILSFFLPNLGPSWSLIAWALESLWWQAVDGTADGSEEGSALASVEGSALAVHIAHAATAESPAGLKSRFFAKAGPPSYNGGSGEEGGGEETRREEGRGGEEESGGESAQPHGAGCWAALTGGGHAAALLEVLDAIAGDEQAFSGEDAGE